LGIAISTTRIIVRKSKARKLWAKRRRETNLSAFERSAAD
jgi:hypothetical protein